jgi:hypothetical protein
MTEIISFRVSRAIHALVEAEARRRGVLDEAGDPRVALMARALMIERLQEAMEIEEAGSERD